MTKHENVVRSARFRARMLAVLLTLSLAPISQATPAADWAFDDAGDDGSGLYSTGRRALDEGAWSEASDAFEALAAEGGSGTDRALFWLAYSQHKAAQRSQALSTLKRLTAEYPQSAWADDAKALEIEIKSAAGKVPAPEREGDDELKLYAIDGLMGADPERAVPLLLKFLGGNGSQALKERALFVLSQSELPAALAALDAVARGKQHPELQRHAIENLGITGTEAAIKTLEEIYRATASHEVKDAVLNAFVPAEAGEATLRVARGEKDGKLRSQAIQVLGVLEQTAGLRELYSSEATPALRQQVLEALAIAGDFDTLIKIARTESDALLRRGAIEGLAIVDNERVTPALVDLYRSIGDREAREEVLQSLFIREESKALLEIFRSEKDRELRKKALQFLSMMDDEEATKLLESILEQV